MKGRAGRASIAALLGASILLRVVRSIVTYFGASIAGLFVMSVAALSLAAEATAQPTDGEAAFARHCVHCHGPGAEAVGTVQLARTRGEEFSLLTERNDLAAPYVAYVVRNGLKAMPAFVPSDLTAADLDALTAYLTRRDSNGRSGD